MFKYLENNKKLFVYYPLVIYWVVLFISTSLPLESLPSVGLSDKFIHTLAYSGLAVLLFLTLKFQQKYKRLNRAPVLYTFLIGIIYAVIDELHQLIIPGRKCDIIDIIADGIGLILGLLIIWVIHYLAKLKTQSTG